LPNKESPLHGGLFLLGGYRTGRTSVSGPTHFPLAGHSSAFVPEIALKADFIKNKRFVIKGNLTFLSLFI